MSENTTQIANNMSCGVVEWKLLYWNWKVQINSSKLYVKNPVWMDNISFFPSFAHFKVHTELKYVIVDN